MAFPFLAAADYIHDCQNLLVSPPMYSNDVLLRIHFYQVKEKLLSAVRHADHLPEKVKNLQFLPDLSQYMLHRRRNLQNITKAILNHKVVYQWCYPVTLLESYQGSSTKINTIDEGFKFLCKAEAHAWQLPRWPGASSAPLHHGPLNSHRS